MMELVLLMLAILGATFVVTDSKLFAPIRFVAFLRCPQCVGFWVGGGFWILNDAGLLPTWFQWACSASGLALASHIWSWSRHPVIVPPDGDSSDTGDAF